MWTVCFTKFPDSILKNKKLHRLSEMGIGQVFQLHGVWYVIYSGKQSYIFECMKKKGDIKFLRTVIKLQRWIKQQNKGKKG